LEQAIDFPTAAAVVSTRYFTQAQVKQ